MRLPARVAVAALFGVLPAAASAWVWPFARPALPEETARMIAMQSGVAIIEDIDGTLDADWQVQGRDVTGAKVRLVIDGTTGAIERAEMDAN